VIDMRTTKIRVIVCGGRHYGDLHHVQSVLSQWWTETSKLAGYQPERVVIVHGGAMGADLLAGAVAEELGFWTEAHRANRSKHGRAAGPIRNKEMADAGADLCIAFPGGKETVNMIATAEKAGIPVRRAF
jgi:hypothetical protein